jgi:hypothetical protein
MEFYHTEPENLYLHNYNFTYILLSIVHGCL